MRARAFKGVAAVMLALVLLLSLTACDTRDAFDVAADHISATGEMNADATACSLNSGNFSATYYFGAEESDEEISLGYLADAGDANDVCIVVIGKEDVDADVILYRYTGDDHTQNVTLTASALLPRSMRAVDEVDVISGVATAAEVADIMNGYVSLIAAATSAMFSDAGLTADDLF